MSEQESILDSYRIILNVISLSAKNTHAVLCVRTGRILSFTNWMQTAKQLESEPNVKVWYYINKAKIIPRGINLNLPFEYAFDAISGAIIKKPITEQEAQQFIVMSEKSAVLDILHRIINSERDHIRSNLSLQDNIYMSKYEEATRVIYNNEMGLDVPDEIPYIRMHCDLTGEDVIMVAHKIVDKHNFVESRMYHTEMVRMKYTKAIRECDDLASVNLLLDELNRETSIYGRF